MQKTPTVQYGNGFVSSTSGARHVASDDPIQLLAIQMSNLREFISQARSAGKLDDAKLLEDNLRDLQEEYQRQRKQLEDNYESYRHLFGKKEDVAEECDVAVNGGDPSAEEMLDEKSFDENNPFFVGTEDEMREMEHVLKS